MLSRFITDLEGMGLDSDQIAVLANIASIEANPMVVIGRAELASAELKPECTVEDCLKCEAKRFLECVLGRDDDFS